MTTLAQFGMHITDVLNQYANDVRFHSTLDEGQKARRLAVIEAALEDAEPDEDPNNTFRDAEFPFAENH